MSEWSGVEAAAAGVVKKAVGGGERERECCHAWCVVCVRWSVLKLLACCLSASGMALPLWATPHQAPCCFGATSHAMVVLERERNTHSHGKRCVTQTRPISPTNFPCTYFIFVGNHGIHCSVFMEQPL